MRKELKRQIKEDELVSGFELFFTWLSKNKSAVQTGVTAAVVVGAAAWGYLSWQQRRTHEAEAAFAVAMETFAAPLRSQLPEGAKPTPGAPIFETAAEKSKKAAAAFDGVERQFAGHAVALRARYMSALARAEGGDAAEALKLLQSIGEQKTGGLEPALARLAHAELLRREGQADKAVEAFRKLASDASWPLPKDHALMELARALEEARKPAEARETYKRLADDFPSSVYAAEARRRAESLATAS